MKLNIILPICVLLLSCQSTKKDTQIKITGYDWCSPDCDEPMSAFKFSDDGTFNVSTSMFGGMSRWGSWERQGRDKLKLTTTKISTNSGSDKIPDPQIITLVSESKIQVGSTVYKRN
tara:strand:- start:198 stop:548 length:351 start_codon:yes stop_codon:yes gene_type:complete